MFYRILYTEKGIRREISVVCSTPEIQNNSDFCRSYCALPPKSVIKSVRELLPEEFFCWVAVSPPSKPEPPVVMIARCILKVPENDAYLVRVPFTPARKYPSRLEIEKAVRKQYPEAMAIAAHNITTT